MSIQIKVLDIKEDALNIKTLTNEELVEMRLYDLIPFVEAYRKPLYNIYSRSTIESVCIRNLSLFTSVLPVVSTHGKNLSTLGFETNKTCLRKIENEYTYVNVPAFLDVKISDVAIAGIIDVSYELADYYNLSHHSEAYMQLVRDLKKVKIRTNVFMKMNQIQASIISAFEFYLSAQFTLLVLTLTPPPTPTPTPTQTLYSLPTTKIQFTTSKLINSIVSAIKIVARSSDANIINDLFRINAGKVYLDILDTGFPSKELDDYVQQYLQLVTETTAMQKIRDDNIKKSNRLHIYCEIVERKFGAERNTNFGTVEELLKSFNKHERDIINKEYEIITNEWKAALANKCKHKELVSQLYKSPKTRIVTIMEELKAYATKNSPSCKNCGFNLMCPHIYDYFTAVAKDWHNLVPIMRKYILHDTTFKSINYFCNLCGEKLMAKEDTHEVSVNSMDSELNLAVWSYFMRAINSFTFLVILNPKNIARDAIDVIIESLDKYNVKSKQMSTIDADGKLILTPLQKITLTVFCYAYLFDMCIAEKNMMFKDLKPTAKPSLIGTSIVKHIISSSYLIISGLQNTTTEDISKMFMDAYRLMQGSSVGNTRDIAYEIIESIVSDSTYIAACNMAFLAGDIKYTNDITQIRKNFETIYGRNVKTIIADAKAIVKDYKTYAIYLQKTQAVYNDIQYDVRMPKLQFHRTFYEPTYPKRVGSSETNKRSERSKHSEHSERSKHSEQSERSKHSEQSERGERSERIEYTESDYEFMYYESYRLLMKFLRIDDRTKHAQHTKEMNEFIKLEKAMSIENGFRITTINSSFPGTNRQYHRTNVPIHDIYDENGKKHIWKGLIYENGKFANVKELISRKNQEVSVGDFIEFSCSVCGIAESETHTLSDDKIYAAMSASVRIKAFYAFFETICPGAGKEHEFVNNKCKQCGLTIDMLLSNDKAYYDKYIDKYNSMRVKTLSMPEKIKYDFEHTQPEKYDYTVIVKACDINGIKAEDILKLGLMEKIKYTDNVPEFEDDDIQLINSVNSYIARFVVEYNQWRNQQNNDKLPELIYDIRKYKSSVKLMQMCLCAMSLSINSSDTKTINKDLINAIIRGNRCTSKAEKVNLNSIFARDDALDSPEGTPGDTNDASEVVNTQDTEAAEDADDVKDELNIDELLADGNTGDDGDTGDAGDAGDGETEDTNAPADFIDS